MPKGFEKISWKPGRYIDFSDPGKIVIRDADDKIIATDLHISEADFECLKAELAKRLGRPLK